MIAVPLARFVMTVAVATVVATAFYPVLTYGGMRRLWTWVVFAAVLLLIPLIVPPSARFLRLLASVCAVTFLLKLYDLHVGARDGVRPTLGQFPVFLFNIFSLVQRSLIRQPPPHRPQEWRRLVLAAPAFLAAMALAVVAFRADWSRWGFWAEHAAKVVIFFLVVVPLAAAFGSAWRLMGLPGRDHMNNPFASRTPADFWRRYNRPVHEFLTTDIFKPLTARLTPGPSHRRAARGAVLRATLVTFLVSAAVHEYVFAMPIGKVQGYQTAFFLLQGLAVAATLRVKPRGGWVFPWVAATLCFNIATGVLFFASLNHVVPFYQHPPPLWGE